MGTSPSYEATYPRDDMTTPASTTPTGPPTDQAARIFSLSILVSAVRCLLTYVVFPWVLPLLGHAGGVGPAIGVIVGAIAIVANVVSIRRFRSSTHVWRRPVIALNSAVIALLVVLVIIDVGELAS
jgi:hypothetical protein